MASYLRSCDLEHTCLTNNDHVYFYTDKKLCAYDVKNCYLADTHGFNGSIFYELGINDADKQYLASRMYGYPAIASEFPKCKENDYEALTRFVLYLLKLCEYKFDLWK